MSERELHQQVSDYLRLQYPRVLFRTDMGGVRLTEGQARQAKRVQHSRAWPDIFIAEQKAVILVSPALSPMSPDNVSHHIWPGLFIELKKEGTKLYLKDGVTMVANPHYREQADTLGKLREKGYRAVFCCGFDEAKRAIDTYLSPT